MFNMPLDKGPDHSGAVTDVHKGLATEPLVIVNAVWCMYHQSHLIDKAVLVVLETWTWCGGWPVNYFTAVSNMSTTMRSPGMKRNAQRKVHALFFRKEGYESAKKAFSTSVGRCLRGRWGAIDAVEDWLIAAWPYLNDVLSSILGFVVQADAPADVLHQKKRRRIRQKIPPAKPDKQPGQDEDDDFKAKSRAARENSVALANDRLFCAAVRISRGVKQPLRHFMNWSDKMQKEVNAKRKQAKKEEATYLGPTACSVLVEKQADKVMNEIATNLSSAALRDERRWAPLWRELQDPAQRSEARQLIVETTLLIAASWHFRILSATGDFLLIFMLMVAVPAHIFDPRRQGLAGRLLGTNDCCLKAKTPYSRGGVSDMAWKVKAIYFDEFQTVQNTGRVPLNLFSMLLVWRAQFSFEAKATEGMHVQLQRMARVAPHLGHPLASDRMQIKLGDDITPTECCELHHITQTEMSTQKHINRFGPIVLRDDSQGAGYKPCEHMKPQFAYHVTGFVQAAQPLLPRGAGKIYTFAAPLSADATSCAYITAWTYFSRRSLARGLHTPGQDNVGTFKLKMPLELTCAYDVISAIVEDRLARASEPASLTDGVQEATSLAMVGPLGGDGGEQLSGKRRRRVMLADGDRVLKMYAYNASWPDLGDDELIAQIAMADVSTIEAKWQKPRSPKSRHAAADISEGATATDDGLNQEKEAEAEDEDIDPDDWLAAELGRFMEEDLRSSDGEGDAVGFDAAAAAEADAAGAGEDADIDEDGVDIPQAPPSWDVDEGGAEASEAAEADGGELSQPLDDLRDVHNEVRSRANDQRSKLGEAAEKARACAGEPLQDRQISLVWHDDDAIFVRWTDARKREAQVISLDALNRVKAIVAFCSPKLKFAGARVIVVETGAVMQRVKGKERPQMSEWCLKLRRWHQARCFAGPLPGEHTCVWCEAWERFRGNAPLPHEEEHVRKQYFACTSCVLVWCDTCARAFSKDGVSPQFVCPPCQRLGPLMLDIE